MVARPSPRAQINKRCMLLAKGAGTDEDRQSVVPRELLQAAMDLELLPGRRHQEP